MVKNTVSIIGASGMIGSMVLDVLSRDNNVELIATVHTNDDIPMWRSYYPNVNWCVLNADKADVSEVLGIVCGSSWVINNVGVVKSYICEADPKNIERAITVNALFPHQLAKAAVICDAKVLQIATDCVYAGLRGKYSESDSHDALDVYGKTKSLGEVYTDNVYCLRCSAIGPEQKGFVNLLEWFFNQPKNTEINGYINHLWNGVTTLHFAKICKFVVKADIVLPHVQHVVPADHISKYELLRCLAQSYGRNDLLIRPIEAAMRVDRTLSTNNQKLNVDLWVGAGYSELPTIPSMVNELSNYKLAWQ